MTSISPISFRGGGTESAGSIAYRNNKPEDVVKTPQVNFRGGGTESAGSIAAKDIPTQTNVPANPEIIKFRGGGTETAGSIATKEKPTQCPECGSKLSFKGSYKENKKGVSTTGILAGLVGLTAATIICLGYAHKKGAFKNLSEGWVKTAGEKIEPMAAKCHEWCGAAKKTGLEWWNKIKNIGSSK